MSLSGNRWGGECPSKPLPKWQEALIWLGFASPFICLAVWLVRELYYWLPLFPSVGR